MYSQRTLTTLAIVVLVFASLQTLSSQVLEPSEQSPAARIVPELLSGNPSPSTLNLSRIPRQALENFSLRRSNVDLYISNFGTIGLNGKEVQAGGMWPRGSGRQYIQGGGFWFGAKIFAVSDPEDPASPTVLQPRTVISYNPNTRKSWFVPGEISQPINRSGIDRSKEGVNLYRLYSSLDYDPVTGQPFDQADIVNGGPNWPIWDGDPNRIPGAEHYFGEYVLSSSQRTQEIYPDGPAMISDEDVVAVFKDTDLWAYETKGEPGYPLGIQTEQQVLSWEDGRLKDVVIIRYRFINMSNDTLFDCYVAPVYDVDIGSPGNDRVRILEPVQSKDTLNLGVVWSEQSAGDSAFGYFAIDMLETPAIYTPGHSEYGYLRRDKPYYEGWEQLGLHSLRNWIVNEDPQTSEERYQYIASPIRDGDNGPGDKRLCMSTGSFAMRPGDTATVAIALIFANGAEQKRDGSLADLRSLIELDIYTQQVYDSLLRTSSVEGEEFWKRLQELDLR